MTSTPAGIDWSGHCQEVYPAGTVVTLTAAPRQHLTFDGWVGPYSGTGACQVTMDAAKQVTATFDVEGAIAPQGGMMYYGPQLEVRQRAAATVEPVTTRLVVFAGATLPGLPR